MPALWFRRKPFPLLKSPLPINPGKRRKSEKRRNRKPSDALMVRPQGDHAMAVVRNRVHTPIVHAVNGELNPNDVLQADLLKDPVGPALDGGPRGQPGAANGDRNMAAPNVVVNGRQAAPIEARKAIALLRRRIRTTVDQNMVQHTLAPVARVVRTPVPVTVTTEAVNSAPVVLDPNIVNTRVALADHVVHSADMIVISVSTADMVAGTSDHSPITQTTDISVHRMGITLDMGAISELTPVDQNTVMVISVPHSVDHIEATLVVMDITLDTDTVTTSGHITADQNVAVMVISDLPSVDHAEATSVARDITRDTDMATVLEHITADQNAAVMVISDLHLVDHTVATSVASDHAVGMNTDAISDHTTAIAGISDPHSGISGHAADNSAAVRPAPSLADRNANIVATSDHVTIQADSTKEMGRTMDAIAIITLVRVDQAEARITWGRVLPKTADLMPVHALADQNRNIVVNSIHLAGAQAGSAEATWDRAMETTVDPVLAAQVEWEPLRISQVADGVDSRLPIVLIANQDAMSGHRRMDENASRGRVMSPAVMRLAANVYATRDDA